MDRPPTVLRVLVLLEADVEGELVRRGASGQAREILRKKKVNLHSARQFSFYFSVSRTSNNRRSIK